MALDDLAVAKTRGEWVQLTRHSRSLYWSAEFLSVLSGNQKSPHTPSSVQENAEAYGSRNVLAKQASSNNTFSISDL